MVQNPNPLFPREHTIHPALFLGVAGVERGQGLGQGPETGVAAGAVVGEEALQGFAAAGAKRIMLWWMRSRTLAPTRSTLASPKVDSALSPSDLEALNKSNCGSRFLRLGARPIMNRLS